MQTSEYMKYACLNLLFLSALLFWSCDKKTACPNQLAHVEVFELKFNDVAQDICSIRLAEADPANDYMRLKIVFESDLNLDPAFPATTLICTIDRFSKIGLLPLYSDKFTVEDQQNPHCRLLLNGDNADPTAYYEYHFLSGQGKVKVNEVKTALDLEFVDCIGQKIASSPSSMPQSVKISGRVRVSRP